VILGASFLVQDANVRLSLRFLAIVGGSNAALLLSSGIGGGRHEAMIPRKRCYAISGGSGAAAALCRLLGLAGLGIANLAGLIVTALFLLRSQDVPFQLRISRKEIAELMRVGVPFSLTEAGYELLRRVDVFVIALLLGPTTVGSTASGILVMDFAVVLDRGRISGALAD